jgi:uncharacterized membrane protein YbaN (DUF454 family)
MLSPHLNDLRTRSQRLLWLLAGFVSLLLGIVGIFLPLLPTTPFVLLAAFCFSRGSERVEAWLLNHRRFGPMVRAWRRNRAVPLRAKQLATVMMAASCIGTAWVLHSPWRWAPSAVCLCVALWLWSLPTTPPAPSADE